MNFLSTRTPSITLCLVAAALPRLANAQVQQEWRTTWGNPADDDFASACAVASNGDVYVAVTVETQDFSTGMTYYSPQFLKLSSAGAILWIRSPGLLWDIARYNQILLDGNAGVYFVGVQGGWANGDAYVRKYDSGGVSQWTQTVAGPAGASDYAVGALDGAGNVVLMGLLDDNDRTFIRSYSPSGALNFHFESQLFAGADGFRSAALAPNGESFVVGSAANTGYVAKFDASGVLQWMRTAPNSAYSSVALDPVGRIAVGGLSSAGSSWDALVALYDVAGLLQWSREYDGAGLQDQIGQVAFSSDGAIWAAGSARAAADRDNFVGSGDHDNILGLRYDLLGNRTVTFESDSHGSFDASLEVIAGEAGQVWLMCYAESVSTVVSSGVLIELDASGGVNWTYVHGSPMATGSFFKAVLTNNRRLVAVGQSKVQGHPWYEADIEQIDISDSPQGYCTPKINSLGCTPSLVFMGMPSASAAGGFTVSTSSLLNQSTGLYFYGTAAASVPFQGGTKCVATPIYRAPLGSTGGSPLPANDCSGILALDFNALASGALGGIPAAALSSVGTDIFCQAWTRDSASVSGTNLSSALRYTVLP